MAQEPELREGLRRRDITTGRVEIYRGGQWQPVDAPGARLLPDRPVTGDRRSEEAYWRARRTQGDPAVTQAEQGVSASRRAEGLLRRQENQGGMFGGTGGIYSVPVVGQVAGLLDPEIRELDALQARQARLERQPGEGAISDFDAAQFVAMTYGKDKPMETNRALIQAQRVANDAVLQRREFDEWYFSQYGTTVGSQEAWRVYAQENPIFDPASQRDGTATLNRNRATWREYFTGDPGLQTQAFVDATAAAGMAGPTDPATGLPSYSGMTRTNGRELPFSGPSGPGSAPDLAIDVSDPSIPRDELVRILSGGGWVRNGQGEPYQVGAGAVRFAGAGETGRQIRPGVIEGAPETPAQAVAEREGANPILRQIDAGVRGAADALTFGFADEIAAGLETVAPITGGAAGWTEGFPQAFQQNLARERAIDESDIEGAGGARLTGQVAGALAGGFGAARVAPQILRNAPRVAGSTAGQTASRVAKNTARQAAIGGTGAAVYGFGSAEGDVGERLPEAGQAAMVGGVLGPVASKVGESVLTPAVGAISRGIGLAPRRSALEGAVQRFDSRFNPNPNALSQQADDLEAMGIQPAFVDVMDRGQRGLGRALAMRQTPAREAVGEFAEGRAEALPGRISTQARRTISQDPRSPLEIRDQVAESGRKAAKPLYEAAYQQPFVPSPLIENLIQRPAGQDALRRAARIAANEGRDPMQLGFDFNEAGDVIRVREPSFQTLDYVKRGLDDVLEGQRNALGQLNLDTEGLSIQSIRRQFVDELDRLNPAYKAARQSYADNARLREATELGEGFLTTEADEFAAKANRLTPPEREVARAAARRAVERGAGTQGQAPGVAQRLASGPEQGIRTQALMGDDAPQMQKAMRAERQLLMNARDINPGQGSPSIQNQSDVMEAGGNVLSAGMNAFQGNVRGTVGSLARLVRLGYSDREAEAIMMAVIDPAQTRTIINMLVERGLSKEKARNLTRALRYYASQRSGEMAAGDQ